MLAHNRQCAVTVIAYEPCFQINPEHKLHAVRVKREYCRVCVRERARREFETRSHRDRLIVAVELAEEESSTAGLRHTKL